ncbi:hypothetical protein [Actinoplanes sp. NPDC026619]|uniref:hypothetical protein n=1 Tax=Actinoplanes sp. NPDC026619 TaxID=3155798 RepID=UPI0033C47C13
MNLEFLGGLPEARQSRLAKALADDAFVVPVAAVTVRRQTGETRVRYLHTTVEGIDYLPLFTDAAGFATLGLECAGTVRPPLSVLHDSVGDLPTVIDLDSEMPFTVSLKALLILQRSIIRADRQSRPDSSA